VILFSNTRSPEARSRCADLRHCCL
jgi:hypothetical protein